MYKIFLGAIAMLLFASVARAGGPKYVAGASYFDPTVKGMPITWANGTISYFTDQGSLSATMSGSSADAFVAAAFAKWTSISTAAVSAVRGGATC